MSAAAHRKNPYDPAHVSAKLPATTHLRLRAFGGTPRFRRMAHILLVDDDDGFRDMLRQALVKMGHTVIEARNGRDALEVHAVQPADVILTDIIMPETEGLETIMTIRRTQPETRIVAMSGGGCLSPQQYLSMAEQLGANAILQKPFSIAQMAVALERALDNLPPRS
jgi:DNA-binding NtrC family response regulator